MKRKISFTVALIVLISTIFYTRYAYSYCLPFPTVENGILIKDCKPYRAIGVNYFDGFLRTLRNPKDKSYKKGLKLLSKNGIPFIRVNIGGYWPKDWELYIKHKDLYFSLLDEFIKTAEKYNLGLVITFFWNISAIPDLMGEPISALGNPKSKTIAFIKNFTYEVVSRYKNSPAIWIWEFGNEYSNFIDLPGKKYPKTAPQFGTPRFRTKRDKVHWSDIVTAFLVFADTVRKVDKIRLLSTGNSIPRPSAYNLAFYKKWAKDTKEQFKFMLSLLNPEPYNLISVHLYPHHLGKYFNLYNFNELIEFLNITAKELGKILFIGEFGVCRKNKYIQSLINEKKLFFSIINAIYAKNIYLSAIWVYDRVKKSDPCNITFYNDRKYQLEYISKLNLKLQKEVELWTK